MWYPGLSAAAVLIHRSQSLRVAAWEIVKDKPEGDVLRQKVAALDDLDDQRKAEATPQIWMDLAHIVAQAATETNHRKAFEVAAADWLRKPNHAEISEASMRIHHPLVALLQDVAAEVGRLMLIEALVPGSSLLVPPTDLASAISTAITMRQITDGTS